ncbi:helix-turn-helix domain-containing protein [Spirochaeta lutea]|uniref:HTH araC/xylS-type domain-containing protein n=1 Tax=Spirochaeta lutea TaxID=1480694 RepID=A0A098R0L1_9SPIO|nr:helix-turn-helix domain-containing protein [Spirochaeta lutea]KGE73489.1 hypothetical protein DC28_03315 [Spirochaeta lutea]
MKYKKRISISILVILLVPVILNTIVLFVRMYDQTERERWKFIVSTNAQLQSTMDYFVTRIQTDLVYLSSRPELKNLKQWYETSDFREKRNFFLNFDPFSRLSDYYDEAYLVHPKDNLMLDLKNKLVSSIEHSSAGSTIQRLNKTLESFQGEKDILLSLPGQPSSRVFLIRSIQNSADGSSFYMYIQLNENFFKSLLDEIFIIDNSFVIITNQYNEPVIIRQSKSSLSLASFSQDWLNHGTDQGPVIHDRNGRRYLITANQSADTGWRYLYGVDYSSIHDDLARFLVQSGLITAGIMMVLSALAPWLVNSLYRPLENLVLSLGDPDGLQDVDEFSRIQLHIKRLSDRNKALNTTLYSSNPYQKEGVIQALLHDPELLGSSLEGEVERAQLSLLPQSGDQFLIIECLLKSRFTQEGTTPSKLLVVERDATIAKWFHFHQDIAYETVLTDDSKLVFICRIPHSLLSGQDQSSLSTFDICNYLHLDEEITGNIYLGCSTLHPSLYELSDAYKEARIAIEYRTLFPNRTIVSYTQIISGQPRLHFYPYNEEMRIINAVKQRDRNQSEAALEQFYAILGASGLPFTQLKHAVFHLLDSLLKILKEFDVPLKQETVERITEVSQTIEETIDTTEMHQGIQQLLAKILDVLDDTQSSASVMIAESVKAIIDQTYTDRNLSLDQIADQLRYSVSHISAIFKTAYGETIKQYITNLRLAKARELLISTDHKVETIGKETGYDNVGSFVKIFKAYMGETPKEFRLRNRLGQQ